MLLPWRTSKILLGDGRWHHRGRFAYSTVAFLYFDFKICEMYFGAGSLKLGVAVSTFRCEMSRSMVVVRLATTLPYMPHVM